MDLPKEGVVDWSVFCSSHADSTPWTEKCDPCSLHASFIDAGGRMEEAAAKRFSNGVSSCVSELTE